MTISLLLLGGCAGNQPVSNSPDPMESGDIAVGPEGLRGLDLGDDWDESIRNSGTASTNRGGGQSASPGTSPTGLTPISGGGTEAREWAIVLFTFTGVNHAVTAADAAKRVRTLGPSFTTVRHHVKESGSMVLFGFYSDRKDPLALEDLNRLRNTGTEDGRRLFPQVMITHIKPDQAALRSPHDLRSLRRQYGANRTLYTLDVAMWSTFDDPNVNYQHLRQEAEAWCRKLRTQGFESYFYHNDDIQVSNVTVGIFASNAVDAQTGIYSDEVMNFVKQFPVRYNNGELLQIPIDRLNPDRGFRPQSPVLVEVPK